MIVKTQYSIISRGTEKYSGHGYMGVSFPLGGKQYILDVDHNILYSDLNDHVIPFEANKYSIENISLSRFQLIFELIMERYKIKDNILILGLGNLGFACLFSLISRGYKNISVYVRNDVKNLDLFEKQFNVKINIVKDISDDYKTYIEATGSSQVIEKTINNISNMKDLIILSTPRDGNFLIDPLIINRKNLLIIGGHELNGVNKDLREKLFSVILNRNTIFEVFIKKFVSINNYSDENKLILLNKKNNYIDVFKY